MGYHPQAHQPFCLLCSLLSPVCCVQCAVCCVLSPVCCVLCAVCCVLCDVGFTWSLQSNTPLLIFTCTAGGAPPPGGWRVRTRVEPKTFFANERTFLAWLNVSVLVMLAGLGLLTGSSLLVPAQSAAVSSTQASGCMASLACAASRVRYNTTAVPAPPESVQPAWGGGGGVG